jgi:probable phosphoglycerate mutase
MELYVTRHGQTNMNAANLICGQTDAELSSAGIKQAETLAKYIADNKIDIHIIISSPMKRAVETAKIIGKSISVSVFTDARLTEQNYGSFEGIDRYDKGFLNNKRNFAFTFSGGESQLRLAVRVYSFLDEIKEKYKDKNVLVVSHGGVCRIINTYFEEVTNEEFFNWKLDNAELRNYSL